MKIAWKKEFLALQQRFSERTAVTDAAATMTFREIFDRAAGIAALLASEGIAPGTPVATFLKNSRTAVWTSYGVTLAGAAEASINPYLGMDDVRHCLMTCGAGFLLTENARIADLAPLRASLPGLQVISVERVGKAELASLKIASPSVDDWGKIIFTSGTTGKPKGIVYTHGQRWLANIVLRAHLPVAPAIETNLLLLTPFSHGSSLMTYAYLDSGGQVTLLDGVDVEDVERRLTSGAISQLFAPPTVLAKLMTKLDASRVEGIRTIFCGTAPLSRELYRRVRGTFGPVVRITYGKSETFNPITVLTPEETEKWYESDDAGRSVCVGWPASGVEIDFATEDPAGEAFVAGDGAPILLRARHQFAGTLIEGTFHAHAAEEYQRTGDVGFMDEKGRLHLVAREADLMKSGGYRVGPEEVETVLRAVLPKVDFCVVGMPSEYWGEIITAVAGELDEGWESDLTDAIATMSSYKRPRLFARLDALPRNAMGKIVRADVLKSVSEHYDMSDGPYPTLTPKRASST